MKNAWSPVDSLLLFYCFFDKQRKEQFAASASARQGVPRAARELRPCSGFSYSRSRWLTTTSGLVRARRTAPGRHARVTRRGPPIPVVTGTKVPGRAPSVAAPGAGAQSGRGVCLRGPRCGALGRPWCGGGTPPGLGPCPHHFCTWEPVALHVWSCY